MTKPEIVAEAFFFARKEDDGVCFHVNDIHVAVLTQEEAQILMRAMRRDGAWSSTKFGTKEEMQS